MTKRGIISYSLLLNVSLSALAGGENCIVSIAKKNNIDPVLILSIARKESNFNPKAKNHNNNGTYDLGLMQINSSWRDKLKKKGISFNDLYDVCTNVKTAVWILKNNFKDYGKNWHSIGVYHAGTRKGRTFSKIRQMYAYDIFNNWSYLRMRPDKQKKIYEKLLYSTN
ncbi:MAG: lytic transglycosylase domain-containing protein [Halobacteriovoraceae bacterium]|nr:lytic transglycosylase domain-containing protein [Halobacteriovoraceae bacterium]